MYTNTKIQIFHFAIIEGISQAEICREIQIVHQPAGAIAFIVHFPLFDVTDIFYIRNTFSETESPVHRPVEVVEKLEAQYILVGRVLKGYLELIRI